LRRAKRDVQHADVQLLTINELRDVDPAASPMPLGAR
jgi:hypothetical protein